MLKNLPFGLQLLRVVGYVFTTKAKEFLPENSIRRKLVSKIVKKKGKETESELNHAQAIAVMKDLQRNISNLENTFKQEQSVDDIKETEIMQYYIQDRTKQQSDVLSLFIKTVWLGVQSEIQSVLEEVCNITLANISTSNIINSAIRLDNIGTIFRSRYQSFSRRQISIFYWDVCMRMGFEMYRQDARYSMQPQKVVSKDGTKLSPDSAIYEYVQYGLGNIKDAKDGDPYDMLYLRDDNGKDSEM